MVKYFTANEWDQDIHLHNETTQRGIFILQDEHQVTEPIIQVFEKFGDDQYNLVYEAYRLNVSITSTKIVLFTPAPFDGKVVIK